MKTLIVLRHAKSSWEDAKLKDIERPLISKGQKRTMLVSNFLIEQNIKVDYVVSSPAIRATETAKIICLEQNFPIEEIIIDEHLYFVSTEKYYEAVFAIPDTKHTALIVGHNPMLTSFVNELSSTPIRNLPTSGLLVVTFNTLKWNTILSADRETKHLIFPKKLESR